MRGPVKPKDDPSWVTGFLRGMRFMRERAAKVARSSRSDQIADRRWDAAAEEIATRIEGLGLPSRKEADDLRRWERGEEVKT